MQFPSELRVVTLKNVLGQRVDGQWYNEPDYYVLKYLSEKLRFRYDAQEMVIADYLNALDKGLADIGLGRLGIKEEVARYADFTTGYRVLDIGFVIEKSGGVPKFEVFAYPFSMGVWIACLVVLLCSTWLSKWISASRTPLPNTFLSLFGSMLRQPLDIHIDSLDR